MEREYVGLRTYRYSFPLADAARMRRYAARLSDYGTVTELALNNAVGFLVKF